MKTQIIVLMAALGLITSASTQTTTALPTVPIIRLPYTITTPGIYVLTSDLSFPVPSGTTSATPAILIATNIPGEVIVNLKGHTITSTGNNSVGIGIGFVTPGIANTYPITVRNGTLQNFSFGVWAESGNTTVFLSNITVGDLTVNILEQSGINNAGVLFDVVNNSVVRNSTIKQTNIGIEDFLSAGGNKYVNVTFQSVGETLTVNGDQNGPNVLLEQCEYAPPQ